MTMTIEKAIAKLNGLMMEPSITDDECEALEMAVQCMKKQIPRARILNGKVTKNGYCPECGARNWEKTVEYCSSCGQHTPYRLSKCIKTVCYECVRGNAEKVCEHYADKADEIRRIHESAGVQE